MTAERAAASEVLDALRERRAQVIAMLLDALVPGYPRRRRFPELEAGTEQAFDAILARMADGRPLVRDDIPFVRTAVRQAALRGGSEAEILKGPLHAQRVLWNLIVDLAAQTGAGTAPAVTLAPVLMDYVDVASELTHETYIEIHEALSSRASLVRFELLEDLLAGRMPAPGPRLSAARGCGLEEGVGAIVIVARSVAPPAEEAALPLAARALAQAPGDVLEPLAVAREDEVVVVRSTSPGDVERLAGRLESTRAALAAEGIELAIATSAIHDGLAAVPAAYEEACIALESMRGRPGVLALPTVSTLEFLILRAGHRTAWQLVPPALREFVEQDLADAALLTDTLLAYVENDLNVKRAAEQLFIHPNTAHYRLDKIQERTGCNLRRFDDLEELLIAIKLAKGR